MRSFSGITDVDPVTAGPNQPLLYVDLWRLERAIATRLVYRRPCDIRMWPPIMEGDWSTFYIAPGWGHA